MEISLLITDLFSVQEKVAYAHDLFLLKYQGTYVSNFKFEN